MNPILQSAIGSILRWALAIIAGYIVKKGIWTATDATTYIEAGTMALLALGWSLWEKYSKRSKLLTALMLPAGSTENDVNAHLASGAGTPSVLTPPDTAPGVSQKTTT